MQEITDYEKELIDFMLDNGALSIGDFTLNSGRSSPYFINTGEFDDGERIAKLGRFYAKKITDNFTPDEYDIIFGPAYKGIPLSVATAIALYDYYGINKGYAFNRKEAKGHGEATNIQKELIVGSEIKDSSRIIVVDDVVTSGSAAYTIIKLLNSTADNLKYVGLVVAVDRQEVGLDGKSAIRGIEETTKMKVCPITDISTMFNYLLDNQKITPSVKAQVDNYLTRFGNEDVKALLQNAI